MSRSCWSSQCWYYSIWAPGDRGPGVGRLKERSRGWGGQSQQSWTGQRHPTSRRMAPQSMLTGTLSTAASPPPAPRDPCQEHLNCEHTLTCGPAWLPGEGPGKGEYKAGLKARHPSIHQGMPIHTPPPLGIGLTSLDITVPCLGPPTVSFVSLFPTCLSSCHPLCLLPLLSSAGVGGSPIPLTAPLQNLGTLEWTWGHPFCLLCLQPCAQGSIETAPSGLLCVERTPTAWQVPLWPVHR